MHIYFIKAVVRGGTGESARFRLSSFLAYESPANYIDRSWGRAEARTAGLEIR